MCGNKLCIAININENIPGQRTFVLHATFSISVDALPLPPLNKQARPPFAAGGSLHDRVLCRVPEAHVTEHAPENAHCPQLPLTVTNKQRNK